LDDTGTVRQSRRDWGLISPAKSRIAAANIRNQVSPRASGSVRKFQSIAPVCLLYPNVITIGMNVPMATSE
jgi:hypothetical protein